MARQEMSWPNRAPPWARAVLPDSPWGVLVCGLTVARQLPHVSFVSRHPPACRGPCWKLPGRRARALEGRGGAR